MEHCRVSCQSACLPRKVVTSVPSLWIKDRSQPQAPLKGWKVGESTALLSCPFCYLPITYLLFVIYLLFSGSRTGHSCGSRARGLCYHVSVGRSQTPKLLLEPGRDVSSRAKPGVSGSPWRRMMGEEAAAS